MMKSTVIRIAYIGVLLIGGQTADAAMMYGTSRFNSETTGTSWLYTIDPLTGATTQIGDTGFAINGLDYHNGTLYAIERMGGSLLTIDTTTGAGTAIAPLVGPNSTDPRTLAINAAGDAYAWTGSSMSDLVRLDLDTGDWSIVGDSGIGPTASHGIAFLGNTLYLVNFTGEVYSVDTVSGAATLLGDFTSIDGNYAHHGDGNPDDGLYYGLRDITGDGPNNVLNSLNLTTQTLANTVALDGPIHAVAFVDSAVPEPSTLALLSMGGLGMCGYRWRKRRKPRSVT